MDFAKMNDFAVRYTAAWCGHEPTRVAAFFSEDGSLKINDAAVSVGRSQIAAAANGFMEAFPDMIVKMDELVDKGGNNFVYRWTLIGTNTGPGGTGKRVHIQGYEEWTIG